MRAFLALALVGCSPEAAPVDAGADAGLEPDAGSSVTSGTVDPTVLGPGIDPVVTGLGGTGPPGSHWWCSPTEWNDRVLVHLVGTFGDPADEHAIAERACELGFAAIVPMYENRDAVRAACDEDAACYLAHHVEIVDGVEGAPDPIDVSAESSLRARITTLLAHLAEEGGIWASVRDRIAADDWTGVAISGHSQGAGHALYLAREETLERVIMLAGPSDRLGDGTAAHAPAPWIAALGAAPIPTALQLAYIHDDDSFVVVEQVVDNWDLSGVGAATCAFSSGGGYDPGCRRVRTASDSCVGVSAHLTPVLRRFGRLCRAGGTDFENRATWDHLLLAN